MAHLLLHHRAGPSLDRTVSARYEDFDQMLSSARLYVAANAALHGSASTLVTLCLDKDFAACPDRGVAILAAMETFRAELAAIDATHASASMTEAAE